MSLGGLRVVSRRPPGAVLDSELLGIRVNSSRKERPSTKRDDNHNRCFVHNYDGRCTWIPAHVPHNHSQNPKRIACNAPETAQKSNSTDMLVIDGAVRLTIRDQTYQPTADVSSCIGFRLLYNVLDFHAFRVVGTLVFQK